MDLCLQIFTLIIFILLSNSYCESRMQDDIDVVTDLKDPSEIGTQRVRKAAGTPSKLLPRSCVHCGLLGLKESGYCTLFDNNLNSFTAYCDVTSEPGYAWTLVTSFSRQVVLTEVNQIFKRKSLGDNFPVNEDAPNWTAFRYSKWKMEYLKMVSTHFRMTCSEYGPFKKLYEQNDYIRVNFSSLDPFILQSERCVPTEYARMRFTPCHDCKVAFTQNRDLWALHVDPIATPKCGFPGAAVRAVRSEDNFGFYDHYNTKFSCTKHPWSTTQIWFGSVLIKPKFSTFS